jgi:hypothetical protein
MYKICYICILNNIVGCANVPKEFFFFGLKFGACGGIFEPFLFKFFFGFFLLGFLVFFFLKARQDAYFCF